MFNRLAQLKPHVNARFRFRRERAGSDVGFGRRRRLKGRQVRRTTINSRRFVVTQRAGAARITRPFFFSQKIRIRQSRQIRQTRHFVHPERDPMSGLLDSAVESALTLASRQSRRRVFPKSRQPLPCRPALRENRGLKTDK